MKVILSQKNHANILINYGHKSYWQIGSQSDTMGQLMKNLKFKHLVEYFGIEFIKSYLLTNISNSNLRIKSKRCKQPIKFATTCAADKMGMMNNNFNNTIFEIRIDITPHKSLSRWYEKRRYINKPNEEEVICTIEVNDASRKNIVLQETVEVTDELDIDLSLLKFSCSKCTRMENEDLEQNKPNPHTKCIHIFRSLMEYVEYDPKDSEKFLCHYDSNSIFHWLGTNFGDDQILSKQQRA